MDWHTAYLGLGSNLGDRRAFITRAIDLLMRTPGIVVQDMSRLYETAPVGMTNPDAPAFLNAAVAVRTTLTPEDLLGQMRSIELQLGRASRAADDMPPSAPPIASSPRSSESRVIDLDLLLYDALVLPPLSPATDRTSLVLPHPRMHQRRFVLDPLAEIAPDLLHPTLHRTIQSLRDALPD